MSRVGVTISLTSWAFAGLVTTADTLINRNLQNLRLNSNMFSMYRQAIVVVWVATLLTVLPPCVRWMALGACLASVFICGRFWLMNPRQVKEPHLATSTYAPTQNKLPQIKNSKGLTAWFNEIDDYDHNTYSSQDTRSVFIQLQGTELCLQTPKENLRRQATWDEELPSDPEFVKQRIYDIDGASVFLLPSELSKYNLWSRRYPLCVRIKIKGHRCSAGDEGGPIIDVTLYLFARCSRDKEHWYCHLAAAASGQPLIKHLPSSGDEGPAASDSDEDPSEKVASEDEQQDSSDNPHQKLLAYFSYMAQVLPDGGFTDQSSTSHDPKLATDYSSKILKDSENKLNESQTTSDVVGGSGDSDQKSSDQDQGSSDSSLKSHDTEKKLHDAGDQESGLANEEAQADKPESECQIIIEPQMIWLNVLLTRCFWDCLQNKHRLKEIQNKIQRRLNKIKMPYFMDELLVTEVDPGREMPKIQSAGLPYIDDRGLWADLDIIYKGEFSMKLQTKCNLMKLTKKTKVSSASQQKSDSLDSGEDSSSSVSSEEEKRPIINEHQSKRRRLLRVMEKFVHSRYVQKATEYKYIKKTMDKVSNTKLLLQVELKHITGRLAINIAHPPTDRIWYGFRKNPSLQLTARPCVGETEVTLSFVTDWIENKLATEFQRFLVMPNMQNMPFSLMSDEPSPPVGYPST